MRELTTIGSLQAIRTMRAVERSARLLPLRGMGWMGQTNADFIAPSASEVDASPPGAALTAATVAMLNHFASSGVPSEHTSDPFVLAFQQAYNADPATWAGLAMPLAADGGYGPNVRDAAAVLVDVTGGGDPPPVNAGASPVAPPAPSPVAPSAPIAPVTPATPAVVPAASSDSHAGLWILAIVAAIAAAYAAHRLLRKKRKGGRRRAALPSRAIVLT